MTTIAPARRTGPGHPIERKDPSWTRFRRSKPPKSSRPVRRVVQRSTRGRGRALCRTQRRVPGACGCHALKRDDNCIDAAMLMNDARYVVVNGDDSETHGCGDPRQSDGARPCAAHHFLTVGQRGTQMNPPTPYPPLLWDCSSSPRRVAPPTPGVGTPSWAPQSQDRALRARQPGPGP